MTWLRDLEYDSDASNASLDDSVVESSVWRGATSPLDGSDWLRELEESLWDDNSKDDCYGGVGTNEEGAFGTNEEGAFGTNEKEGDERLYMGHKKEWYCQRCGTGVKKASPTSKTFPDNCPICRKNKYLCDKNVGILVEIHGGKARGTSGHYVMARIFHTASKGTPFAIDTEAGSMRVTLRPDDNLPDYPSGTIVYKLSSKSIKALHDQLGRGLVGTVAENVDHSRPEVVVVQPAGGGEVVTIENPQFAVLYTDDTITPMSLNLPTTVDPSPPPPGTNKRPRDVPVEIDGDEDLFNDALLEDDAPPTTRQRTSRDVNVHLDFDWEEPVLIENIDTLEMLRLQLNMQYERFGEDDSDVIVHLPSYNELTQEIMDDAVEPLWVLVRSRDAVDLSRDEDPSTALRPVEGMMGINPMLMTNGLFGEEDDGERDRLVDDEDEEDDGERDRLVDDSDEEEEMEEQEQEDGWHGRTALDADQDSRMNEAFHVHGHGQMTLEQYLEQNPDLVPWADFISPHRLSMLDSVANPFLVLTPMFFEGAVSEAQRFVNMHNNAQQLFELGLGLASFDKRFLNGIQWDVNMISNAKMVKKERDRKEAEKRAIKERKAVAQEAERQRRKREREEAGMVRASAKKADRERRIAATDANRRQKAEWKADQKRYKQENKEMRKQDRATMRDVDKLMNPGLKDLETTEEREAGRLLASDRYSKLPWAQASPPAGVALNPDTSHPIVFADVPDIIRDALFWLMAYRLYLDKTDPLTNEMIFRNVNRYYGRAVGANGQRDLSRRQWRSWQLQRKIPGTSGFLGQYTESILAAAVNAAHLIDPRIDSSESALSWVVWILNPVNADRWLRDPVVVQGLRDQEYNAMGRSSSSREQDKYDAEFRTRNPNWIAPIPTTLDIPDSSIIPPAPSPPFPADPMLPMPPPRPPPSSHSDVGSSSGAGSSTDPLVSTLPVPEPTMPPNMDTFTDTELAAILDDNEDLFNPFANTTNDDDHIRDAVQMNGAGPATATRLRESGISALQIIETRLFDVSNLINVFSVKELVDAGVDPITLLHNGGNVSEIRPYVSREILRQEGFRDDDM
tara:strand:+ start:5443 stop:8673 length:3231 start_codon:yes stop_codon:yes gene_type:complete